MEKRFKVHAMDIPKEIIAWFFTEAEKYLLQVELVSVVNDSFLRVYVVYRKKQRNEVMLLIERVDDYVQEMAFQKIREEL